MGTPVIDPSTKKLYVVGKPNTLPTPSTRSTRSTLATGNVLAACDCCLWHRLHLRVAFQQQRPACSSPTMSSTSHSRRTATNPTTLLQADLLGYRKTDLVQVSVTNLTPGQEGGIWQAGTGPAADGQRIVYV